MMQNITIEISEKELEQIVRDRVRLEWKRDVVDFSIELQTCGSGYGMGETTEKRFKCIKVRLNPDLPKPEKYERGY